MTTDQKALAWDQLEDFVIKMKNGEDSAGLSPEIVERIKPLGKHIEWLMMVCRQLVTSGLTAILLKK